MECCDEMDTFSSKMGSQPITGSAFGLWTCAEKYARALVSAIGQPGLAQAKRDHFCDPINNPSHPSLPPQPPLRLRCSPLNFPPYIQPGGASPNSNACSIVSSLDDSEVNTSPGRQGGLPQFPQIPKHMATFQHPTPARY